jgi:hypothetical protein
MRQSGHERHARAKEGANGFDTDKKSAEGAHRFLPFLSLLSPTLRGFFVLYVSLAILVGLLLGSIEAGGDEFSMNRGRIPTLFTGVRGIGILRTSPVSGSRKFTSEVATWQMCLVPHACYREMALYNAAGPIHPAPLRK